MASDKPISGIRMSVELDPLIYPRVYSLIKNIPQKGRAEKFRQLASIGELVESGMLMLSTPNGNLVAGSLPVIQTNGAETNPSTSVAQDFGHFDEE